MKFQNRSGQVVEAIQWFENGDHPEDFPAGAPALCPFEGRVVRYFRYPGVEGTDTCHCGHTFHVHGWIDDDYNGRMVCPGDWIVTDGSGDHHRYSQSSFALNYKAV